MFSETRKTQSLVASNPGVKNPSRNDRLAYHPVDADVELSTDSTHRRPGPLVRRTRMPIAIGLRHHSRFPFGPLPSTCGSRPLRAGAGYRPGRVHGTGYVWVETSDAKRHLVAPLGLGFDARSGHDTIQCRTKKKELNQSSAFHIINLSSTFNDKR